MIKPPIVVEYRLEQSVEQEDTKFACVTKLGLVAS